MLLDLRFQLLHVGTSLYHGVSPRSVLDPTARRLLLPRLRQAIMDGTARSDFATDHGQRWATRVVPVNGPVSGAPLAVLGCYGCAEGEFPAPPLVGAWEWRVTPPGPGQEMRAYWSPSLFDVYGIARPEPRDTGGLPGDYWEAPEWLDRLVVDSDRVEMRRVVDIGLSATTDALTIHSYSVRNPDTNDVYRVRFAGRSYVADHDGGMRWFRGTTQRLAEGSWDVSQPPGSVSYLDAAFTLSADPLMAIDTVYEHIYTTSSSFGDLAIDLPSHRHLPAMCHPDDLPALRGLLRASAANTAARVGPVKIRFAAVGGGWRTLGVTGTGVRLSPGETHHVLCRVTVLDP